MSITGVTFANQEVTPQAMGALFHATLADGFLSGGALAYEGSVLSMGAGWFIADGRVVRFPDVNSFNVNGASSGYARLRLRLDLAQTATEVEWQQGAFYIDYAATDGGFPALTQQDLNEVGTVYEVELCTVALSTAGITGITRQIGSAGGAHADLTVETLRLGKIVLDANSYGDSTPYSGVEGQLFFVRVR